ncbi:hypothetical protein AMS61_25880 [Bacillus sp. FJAT-21351]|nr:hypothetical protein AMS61_25880 [Bacillus sp. FJAT-21351]
MEKINEQKMQTKINLYKEFFSFQMNGDPYIDSQKIEQPSFLPLSQLRPFVMQYLQTKSSLYRWQVFMILWRNIKILQDSKEKLPSLGEIKISLT